MPLDVARSWLGFSARWLGPARTSITGVSEVALPVVVVGHDACDGGGMTGASALSVIAPGTHLRMRLTGARGFALWSLRVRIGAAGAFRLFSARTRDPAALAAPIAVDPWTALRDVVALASVEPGAAPAAFAVPVDGGSSAETIELGRPVVIAPGEALDVWSNGTGTVEFAALFEEGL